MVILTLVSTVAAGMVWFQQRAIEVEAAERARTQATWILNGALDWARLILREDARTGVVDHLGEPWAVPLAEARLSTFLAAERTTRSDDDGPEAFLSGQIIDLQARYNLRNLIDGKNEVAPLEVAVLQRLCDIAGAPSGAAERIATALARAWDPDDLTAPLAPHTLDQLGWLGIEADTVARLAPHVVLLPAATPLNVNTATREVIAAVIDGLDAGSAERLVQTRQRTPFRSVDELKAALPAELEVSDKRVSVSSRFFEVTGRLRLDDRVLVDRSILQRKDASQAADVVAILRERRSALDGPR